MIENIGAYSRVDYNRGYQQGRADAIDEYKNKLIERLIPHIEQLSSAKDSETYLAITEIAEKLKENN